MSRRTLDWLATEVREGFRRHVCVICGHVEWVPLEEVLPQDYRCSLCGAPRSVMLGLEDERLRRHSVVIEPVAHRIFMVSKSPPFRADWSHLSYLLQHPDGLILYDAPPLVTPDAVEAVLALGTPRMLVVSHNDFIGLAADWASVLQIPSCMGPVDQPHGGNRFAPSQRVGAPLALSPDLEIVPVPGHTPGSIALYWSGAPDGPALFAGDALMLCSHEDDRLQLSFCQAPPVEAATRELAERPVEILATCAGVLHQAQAPMKALLETGSPCARPYMDEPGGLWLPPNTHLHEVPRKPAARLRRER